MLDSLSLALFVCRVRYTCEISVRCSLKSNSLQECCCRQALEDIYFSIFDVAQHMVQKLQAICVCMQVAKRSPPEHRAKPSIHCLKQRLAPYGFENSDDGLHDVLNDQLSLDSLFKRERKPRCGAGIAAHFESMHIDLDPCPMEPLPRMPTQQRVEPVTVIYSDGSQAPVTYGIPIDGYATNQQLSNGVREQCKVLIDKQIVLVLLEYNTLGRYPAQCCVNLHCVCVSNAVSAVHGTPKCCSFPISTWHFSWMH